MGIASGKAWVVFGGIRGKKLLIEKGDIIIIPAGLAHKCSKTTAEFLCVGGYPGGAEYDINVGTREELKKAEPRLKKLPKPALDPVFGKEGCAVKSLIVSLKFFAANAFRISRL